MNGLALLFAKDRRVWRNLGRRLRGQSRFKIAFVCLFAVGLEVGLFLLFLDGFRFLTSLGGAGFMITRRLFSLFFLGLGAMLLLSSVVTAYSALFRSRETAFLLTCPVRDNDVVLYKCVEAAWLSSWAFFFMIAPFVTAYAWQQKLGWAFAAWTVAFAVPFILLCGGIGALITLALMRWAPRGRAAGWLLAAVAAAAATQFLGRAGSDMAADHPALLLSRLVPGIQAASQPWIPSLWAAEGIESCARGNVRRGLMFGAALLSNALLLGWILHSAGAAMFRTAYQRFLGRPGRGSRTPVLFAGLARRLLPLPADARAIVMKDLRSFFRDPMQWSQALVFFGLLALYFSSLRSFRYHRFPAEWRNLIAFLNVFSVAAVQCSLASRFLYPQLSLEGQGFWLLGLAPTTPRRIMLTKFVGAAAVMTLVGQVLILVSTGMLQLEPGPRAIALLLTAAISLGVCGLSVGLGAVFLDLRATNPAAIVSGFGGTVNLTASLLFMLAAILPFAILSHAGSLGRIGPDAAGLGLAAAIAWLLALAAAAVAVPLWMGVRSLRGRDF